MTAYNFIASTGSYLPDNIVTNDDLSKTIDTSDEWIFTRTGIKTRHIASGDECTSHMAVKAAKNAIKKANFNINDIDLIIVATTTPDRTFPSTATMVQGLLGIKKGAAFDVQAVCSGFIYAMAVADSLLKSGAFNHALVIGAEKMSALLDWKDRNTCVLFGDAAGAVIISKGKDSSTDRGIIDFKLASDGSLSDILYTTGGVCHGQKSGHVVMNGKEVFKKAVESMSSAMVELLHKNNLTADDIQFFIPHQANIRIINFIANKLNISEDKFVITMDKHANTSAASIPVALDYASDKIKSGDNIMLAAAGGGFTWGAMLLRM